MTRPAIEVADIVRARGRQFLERFKAIFSYQQLKAFRAVLRCRTAALGGHKDKCVDCQYEAPISYNSCRSRCCPKCQAQARRRWLEAQQRDLLHTNYFHVVFTVPHELNPLALTTPRRFFDLLFEASSQTLLEVAADPKRLGAEIGFLSILHTWSSNLLPHYHIHCVVPGGGLAADHRRWINTSHPLFLLPIPVLRTVFRNKFLDELRRLYRKGQLDCRGPAAAFSDPAWFEDLAAGLGKKKWFVYAKPPFGGPAHVLRYLGRYTHRMAISNHRLLAFDGERVRFRWRDYAHGNKQRIMTLDAVEFLRRFFLHVLPRGFVRIRHYGLLSNRFRKRLLPLAHELLAAEGREQLSLPPPSNCDLWHCPRCGRAMHVVQRFTAAELYFTGFDSS
jgi:Putative transposase/Transposase zinc-binding domain